MFCDKWGPRAKEDIITRWSSRKVRPSAVQALRPRRRHRSPASRARARRPSPVGEPAGPADGLRPVPAKPYLERVLSGEHGEGHLASCFTLPHRHCRPSPPRAQLRQQGVEQTPAVASGDAEGGPFPG
jgi:hypothetical protein